MVALATARAAFDYFPWRIYEEAVFPHGPARSNRFAESNPSTSSAFAKRSKAF
jgi:hypothetical protein